MIASLGHEVQGHTPSQQRLLVVAMACNVWCKILLCSQNRRSPCRPTLLQVLTSTSTKLLQLVLEVLSRSTLVPDVLSAKWDIHEVPFDVICCTNTQDILSHGAHYAPSAKGTRPSHLRLGTIFCCARFSMWQSSEGSAEGCLHVHVLSKDDLHHYHHRIDGNQRYCTI